MLDEKLLVFVLGAPGAGKGTQCDLIVKEYGWAHFSAGDLLRAQVKAGTEMGTKAEEYLKAGTMVPASMIIGLLKEALSDAQHTKVLIDGFPRVLDQLKEFEQEVRPCNTALFYNVPEEEAKQRLLKRGQTSGRVDDNEETIHNRFIVFKEESMPVISELEREGRAVEIDAAQSPEQVFAATRKVIEQLEQQQASKAKQPEPAAAAEAPTPAAVAAEAEVVASAVQSPKAPASPAAAAAAGSTPVSLQAAPVAVASPTAVQAAAAASASGMPAGGSPVAAAAAASGVTSPTAVAAAAGAAVPALAALAAGAAAVAATSSPIKSPTAQAADTAAAAGSPDKAVPAIVMPAAVAGVPPHLDVTSPTAAAGAMSPSPRATLASLHVDLSGIRTPIVICGPSGVGKGTLISKLMEQHPDRFGFSVSHTTRGPRPGEVHGKHYYFTERESMAAQVAAGMFLEHANVHGNMYGTSLAAVAQVSAAGKHCVLDIDVQGAAQVRKSALGPHCLFVFVAPPSHEELERRLRHRGTETEDKVLQRLANAESEIAKAQEPGLFHHVLVNADLEVAYQELQKLIGKRVPGLLAADGSSQPAAAAAAGAGGSSSQRTSEAGGAAAAPAASTPTAAAAAQNGTVVSPAAVAAGAGGITAAAAAAATAARSPRTQQQQAAAAAAAHQAHPHHQPALANGNASAAVSAATAGGTSTLLDFGFGASAGPAFAAKGMPVRQYMDATVIPVLRDGLKALNAARPDDPLQFLADFLVAHKAAAA